MSHPTVTVMLKGGKAEFKSHGPESDQFAEYLSKMFEQCNDPAPARATLMAKARLGGTVLDLRKAMAGKASLLDQAAERFEARSREWSLSKEVRELNADRARSARAEAARIRAELG